MGDSFDVGVDDGLFACVALEIGEVSLIVQEEVFCEDGGAVGDVAGGVDVDGDEEDVGFAVGGAVGVGAADAFLQGDVVFRNQELGVVAFVFQLSDYLPCDKIKKVAEITLDDQILLFIVQREAIVDITGTLRVQR